MNAYQVLGLLPGATSAAIKRAYRKLAQKYHPDRNSDPGAEKTFVLVKEAYEFLVSGKSNSGVFDKLKTAPKPAPKSKVKPSQIWETGYGATNVPRAQILVSFQDAFSGITTHIPNTPYKIFVRPGTQHYQKERRLCDLGNGQQAYFDVEFRLYDPIGFYKLLELNGTIRFCCHLEMTSGQVLSGFEHALKNVNPEAGPVIVTIPANYDNHYIRIPRAGMKLDEAGSRSDLYVIPVIRFTPIEEEIQPVLVALNKRVQDALKLYRYFK